MTHFYAWYDPTTCVTWLFICVTHLNHKYLAWKVALRTPIWIDSMTNFYARYDSTTRVTWLFIRCDSFMSQVPCMQVSQVPCLQDFCQDFLYVWTTWLIYTRGMTHLHAWHDSLIRVTHLNHKYLDCKINVKISYLYVQRDSSILMAWLIHMCDSNHSHAWHIEIASTAYGIRSVNSSISNSIDNLVL